MTKDGEKNLDGVGRWGRPSRHRPPGDSATAEALQEGIERSQLPGPPGDINTARHATSERWQEPAPAGADGADVVGAESEVGKGGGESG